LGADDLKLKTVTVAVNWTDRAGQTQGLSLSSAIAGIAPELAGSLSLSGDRAGTQRPGGSQLQAHDLHNGTSGFIPFNRPSGDTTAFLFNNITGLVTLCSSTVLSNAALKAQRDALLASGSDPSILVTCSASATMAVPLSGTVSFATVGTPTQALTPSGMAQTVQVGLTRTFPTSGVSAPVCYTEAPTASSVQYICAVPITALSSPASVWSGYSYVTGASITGAAGGSVVCRYTTGPPAVASRSDLIVPAISNVQHPRAYLKVASGLAAQNFLLVPYVTGTASDCPDGSPLPSGFTTYPQPATAP
jgi:hypothetical protein